jgi:regulator of protease activity HflC (stomatin/prohibitin superfamily)
MYGDRDDNKTGHAAANAAKAVLQRVRLRRLVGFGVVAIAALIVIGGSYFTVHERERVVVTRLGAFSHVAGPGLRFKIPILDSIERYSVAVNSLAMTKLETFTTGAQPQHVDLDITVQWAVRDVEQVFRQGNNPELRLRSMVIDRAKVEFGRVHADQIPTKRGEIVDALRRHVSDEARELYGITVLDLQLVNFDYSPEYRRSVDGAAVAQQDQARSAAQAVSAENVARGQANAAIQAARGQAEATRLQAVAQAEAIRARGEAEAAAIRAQAEALGSNPNLVSLRQAERWDGKLPTNFVPGAAVPFLNLNSGTSPAR